MNIYIDIISQQLFSSPIEETPAYSTDSQLNLSRDDPDPTLERTKKQDPDPTDKKNKLLDQDS